MEIERKFLISQLPENLDSYQHKEIEQGYLSTEPVLRIRRQDTEYWVTYKSAGMMSREEYNLPLNQASYEHLREKIDGLLISKTRYLIPYDDKLTIELDIFHGDLEPLIMAEVEFDTEKEANAFVAPDSFVEEVTYSGKYHNSYLSQHGLD